MKCSAWMAGVVLALLQGCATFQDNMKAGRYLEACNQRFEETVYVDAFDAWLRGAVQPRAELVPLADVETWVGGPLAQYGKEVGVYRVAAQLPGGRVTVSPPDKTTDPALLVAMLPPLAVLTAPLLPPGPYQDGDLAPEPPPEPPSHESPHQPGLVEGLAGAFVGAFLGVGKAIGAAVGAAVAIPLALTVGMVIGGVEVVSGIAGGYHPFYGYNPYRGSTYSSTSFKVDPAPIFQLRPGKVTGNADALLNEHDHRRMVEDLTAQLATQRAQVEAEQARRIQFAQNPPPGFLGCDEKAGTCTVLLRPGSTRAWMSVVLERGGQRCDAGGINLEVQAPAAPDTRPPWPAPTAPNPVTVLDAHAPSWVHELPARTGVPALPATAVTRLEHAVCTVTLPQPAPPPVARRKGKPKALPPRPALDLAVRVTAGRDYPRVMRWALGPVTDETRFLIPGLGLEPGERLRLAFHAKGARSLGGGIVEFTGALPLQLHNDAVSVRCDAADDAAMREAAAQHSAAFSSSMEALGTALKADDAPAMVEHRNATRLALLQWVHHSGWNQDAVTAAWTRLAAEDPAEKHSTHPAP